MSRPDRPRPDQPPDLSRPAGQPPSDPVQQPDASNSCGVGESRYRRVAPGQDPDQPFDIRIEFVVLDGPAGQELALRQARIMRKVLRWIAEHPESANPATT
jgi:hypothetical protein